MAEVAPRKAAQFTDGGPRVNTWSAEFLTFLPHDHDAQEAALADLEQAGWPRMDDSPGALEL